MLGPCSFENPSGRFHVSGPKGKRFKFASVKKLRSQRSDAQSPFQRGRFSTGVCAPNHGIVSGRALSNWWVPAQTMKWMQNLLNLASEYSLTLPPNLEVHKAPFKEGGSLSGVLCLHQTPGIVGRTRGVGVNFPPGTVPSCPGRWRGSPVCWPPSGSQDVELGSTFGDPRSGFPLVSETRPDLPFGGFLLVFLVRPSKKRLRFRF